ncbi:hypothetical protein CDO28_01920 [Sinorhizobium meliloti]|uniref:hypothetical protein n=1 Tax=Rhizobium meliloti TaxID=382 RepID=UPI000B49CE95|nr:hypothetical protein [Sinorhizobium meliloti]ASP70433.1 hypothetical protein CDO28_01920 [Sinorhizobium meliloti]MDE3854877.1 hypothetical protein [Sinorhizobium meliloti]MQW52552.1 hypothetical protein [Sinorhizobium meliloti]
MTPAQAIGALDRQLAVHGETIKLRRGTKDAPAFILVVSGFVRGYKASDAIPDSGITQKDSKVIVSPSDLAGWPSPLPKDGDWCEIDGQFRQIVSHDHLKLDNVVVRIELQVKG